jgi:2-polyprenyl-6-methoxyphenol hydroxylase-like FAD-dependent oxidoreductase
MRRIGEHAVVIGGSMAGLLSASALTDGYDQVTIVERDARSRRAGTPMRCSRTARTASRRSCPGSARRS